MRYGFEGITCINLSGSPTDPVWSVINDICDDETIDDGSDEIEAGTRKHGGTKQTARGRLSREVTLSVERPDQVVVGDPLSADTPHAALMGAARQRQAVVDLAFFDNWDLNEDGDTVVSGDGIRLLALVKHSHKRPFGDRVVDDFECKPGRAGVGQEGYDDLDPLNLAYTFG